MFKTPKILLGNYSSLFRSICFVSNNAIFAKSWNVARVVGTRTHGISLSSSLEIGGRKHQNGGVCLRRYNSNSSYVTPSGVIFHFDTHKLVKKMQENGFSELQAESLTMSLVEIVSSSFGGIADSTVSKIDQERLEVKFTALLDTIRNEMFLLEKGKFAQIEEENERLRAEVKSLKGILQDEVAKLKGGMALDFSLEKSRIKEELAVRDQKIKDTENRIETEVAKLGTQLESQKLDLIKYIVGSLLSCITLFLAVWRFVKT